jgi:L-arabonate dehydrase
MPDTPPKKLRSTEWFGSADKNGFMYRSWMKNQGIPDHEFDGRPIVGICNTWSELTPCNAHFRKIAEHVKRGISEAGGFPVEFPVFSNGESNLRPTAMLTRNLASMDVEEAIRGNPVDAVVLLTGCDKTTPALLMGAASCDIPAIVVTGGPMLNGKLDGKDIGSGTAVWQLHESLKAGEINLHQFLSAEGGMSRSAGTCNTMGTASTMACMAEALGTSLPHNAAIPAVDARRYVLAQMSGMRAVQMAKEGLTLSKILTREAFENAIRVNAAIGGSTNAVIHLKAIAGRIGVELELEDWTRIGSHTPTIVDLMPSGRFLMEEFYYAGGLPAVLRRLGENGLLPHPGALTVNGHSIWDNVREAPSLNDEVIRPLDNPLIADGGIRILRGNLSPRGAVLKPSAAIARAAEAPRPCGGVREPGALQGAHRRRRPRHRCQLGDGAEELRPQGLPRHGRGGQHGPAAEAAAPGREGHGAHLGRAHERHGLWHGGAARGARSGRRRAAGGGARWRLDRARLRCGALHLDISDEELASRLASLSAATRSP